MVEKISCDLTGNIHGLTGAVFRYDVLERLHRCATRRDVSVLAFGFADNELRLVLEGSTEDIGNVLRGVKVGTTRSARKWRLRFHAAPSARDAIASDQILDAVVWAHRGPVEAGASCPLANPWSSHRDLMGFRSAPFFDVSRLRELVDPRTVHWLAGGEHLPVGWPPAGGHEDLSFLLRIAGSVLGVLPADRRCFRLFVHLARARGWNNAALAPALALTPRRIRQLAVGTDEQLGLALQAIGDSRLSCVP